MALAFTIYETFVIVTFQIVKARNIYVWLNY
jgi:hypothetical protein